MKALTKLERGERYMRVSIAIQLISHVFPPSSENACSKRHAFALSFVMMKRTRIVCPFTVS